MIPEEAIDNKGGKMKTISSPLKPVQAVNDPRSRMKAAATIGGQAAISR